MIVKESISKVVLKDTTLLQHAPISNENTVVNEQSLVQDSDHEARVSNKIHNIVMPNYIFSKIKSSRNQYADTTFPIKPFKNIQIRAIKDKSNDIVLEDTTTKVPIAVCRMMYNGLKPWKIYTLSPNYVGQKASKQVFNYSELYTYAEIQGSNSNRTNPSLKLILKSQYSVGTTCTKIKRDNTIDKENDCTYTVTSVGAWTRIVSINGLLVARMETKSTTLAIVPTTNVNNTNNNKNNNNNITITSLTVLPNTDLYVMICLSAICTYIDENTVRE